MEKEGNAFLRLERGRVEDYKEGDLIPLGTDVTVIGRSPKGGGAEAETPDIAINDDYVSRSHVKIYYSQEKDSYILQERDSGTLNGTFIGGKRIPPGGPRVLVEGDLVGLAEVDGECRVLFRFSGEKTLPGKPGGAKRATTRVGEGGLLVDTGARTVRLDGMEVNLRKKEFDLLAFLYENAGKACTRNEIAPNVWREEGGIVSEETIDTNIYRIRKAIEQIRPDREYIKAIRNYGYRLDL